MDSMDFGLGRFLEMFEARFGRVAGTTLLALIGLALATFTGRLVLSGLILPVYEAINAVMDGHQSVTEALDKFARSRLTPFLSTTLWVVMITWCANILFHDGYTLAKRRQIQRDAERQFKDIIDRNKIYGWIIEHQSEVGALITRLDNQANGRTPIVDNAFLKSFLYLVGDLPPTPPPIQIQDRSERDGPADSDLTNPPAASLPSPAPPGSPPGT
jgi:hypothetical protein